MNTLKCYILGCWFQYTTPAGTIIQCKRCKDLFTRVDELEYRGWYQRFKRGELNGQAKNDKKT